MTKRLFGLTALAVIVTVGLAACGGGAAPADTGTEGEGGAAGSADFTVLTHDTFKYEPNTWTAAAGATVNLTLDNSGQALEHSFVLLNEGVTEADAVSITPDGDADKKYFSLVVPIGETASGTFTAPATAGDYVVVCTVAGHAAGGMLGTFTVQ